MVSEILEVFLYCFFLPVPFFFLAYVVRQVKRYFTAAANIPNT